jgi:hypothetical protein
LVKSNPPPRRRSSGAPHAAIVPRLADPKNVRSRRPLGNGDRLHLIFDADDTLWDSNIHFL